MNNSPTPQITELYLLSAWSHFGTVSFTLPYKIHIITRKKRRTPAQNDQKVPARAKQQKRQALPQKTDRATYSSSHHHLPLAPSRLGFQGGLRVGGWACRRRGRRPSGRPPWPPPWPSLGGGGRRASCPLAHGDRGPDGPLPGTCPRRPLRSCMRTQNTPPLPLAQRPACPVKIGGVRLVGLAHSVGQRV